MDAHCCARAPSGGAYTNDPFPVVTAFAGTGPRPGDRQIAPAATSESAHRIDILRLG